MPEAIIIYNNNDYNNRKICGDVNLRRKPPIPPSVKTTATTGVVDNNNNNNNGTVVNRITTTSDIKKQNICGTLQPTSSLQRPLYSFVQTAYNTLPLLYGPQPYSLYNIILLFILI